jgi:hypothetical protein
MSDGGVIARHSRREPARGGHLTQFNRRQAWKPEQGRTIHR